jgi:hypothetical protein
MKIQYPLGTRLKPPKYFGVNPLKICSTYKQTFIKYGITYIK